MGLGLFPMSTLFLRREHPGRGVLMGKIRFRFRFRLRYRMTDRLMRLVILESFRVRLIVRLGVRTWSVRVVKVKGRGKSRRRSLHRRRLLVRRG